MEPSARSEEGEEVSEADHIVEEMARFIGPYLQGYDTKQVAQAALSALRGAGLVVVPIEPTEAMTNAGHGELPACEFGVPLKRGCMEMIRDAYRAMLLAHEQQDHNPSGGRAEAAPDGATEGAPDQLPPNR